MSISRLFRKGLSLGLILFLFGCDYTFDSDKDNNYFQRIKQFDVMLETPQQGEWLAEHHEAGQTFAQYRKDNLVKPTEARKIIYLKPLGQFTKLQTKLLELNREYVEAFFQLKTVLLPQQTDGDIPISARRMRDDGHEQLLAPYILDSVLDKKIPTDGLLVMALSEKDLYPNPEWNFVFGLASFEKKVAVSSIYYLQDEKLTDSNFTSTLRRLIQVSSHEVGHMFTLHHCIQAKCTMNGSNSLPETDNTPNRLCSECQKKLCWNIKYDNIKRLKELVQFTKLNKLLEDHDLLRNDLESIQ